MCDKNILQKVFCVSLFHFKNKFYKNILQKVFCVSLFHFKFKKNKF